MIHTTSHTITPRKYVRYNKYLKNLINESLKKHHKITINITNYNPQNQNCENTIKNGTHIYNSYEKRRKQEFEKLSNDIYCDVEYCILTNQDFYVNIITENLDTCEKNNIYTVSEPLYNDYIN